MILTDDELNIVEIGPDIVISCESDLLDSMDEWCVKTHGESGLTQKVKQSHINIQQAEQQVLAFIHKYTTI